MLMKIRLPRTCSLNCDLHLLRLHSRYNWIVSSSCNGNVFLAKEKTMFFFIRQWKSLRTTNLRGGRIHSWLCDVKYLDPFWRENLEIATIPVDFYLLEYLTSWNNWVWSALDVSLNFPELMTYFTYRGTLTGCKESRVSFCLYVNTMITKIDQWRARCSVVAFKAWRDRISVANA